jgi:predicted TIM-barrel fold metal-dependent hydrolase
MKKIDMHCHTTNRPLDTVDGSASLETIKKYMKKYDIEKTVVLASYFPHRGSGISNFRLFNWIQAKPEFLMFGSLDFEHYFYQGYNELVELADKRLVDGIKIYTTYQKIGLGSEKISKVVDLARRFLLPVAFHCGYSHTARKTIGRDNITDMVKASDLESLAQKYPDVSFIASHLSKPHLDDLIKTVIRNPNMYTDSSGLLDSKTERDEISQAVDEIEKFVEKCGPGKLLFGTDFPVQTHEDSVYFIEEGMKNFSEQDKLDVYYNNSRRLLKLR